MMPKKSPKDRIQRTVAANEPHGSTQFSAKYTKRTLGRSTEGFTYGVSESLTFRSQAPRPAPAGAAFLDEYKRNGGYSSQGNKTFLAYSYRCLQSEELLEALTTL